MRALVFVSLLTFALATAVKADPGTSHKFPHYPEWAAKAFETRRGPGLDGRSVRKSRILCGADGRDAVLALNANIA